MQHAPNAKVVRAAVEVARQTAILNGGPELLIVTPERVQHEVPPEGPWTSILVRLTTSGTRTVIETHRC